MWTVWLFSCRIGQLKADNLWQEKLCHTISSWLGKLKIQWLALYLIVFTLAFVAAVLAVFGDVRFVSGIQCISGCLNVESFVQYMLFSTVELILLLLMLCIVIVLFLLWSQAWRWYCTFLGRFIIFHATSIHIVHITHIWRGNCVFIRSC